MPSRSKSNTIRKPLPLDVFAIPSGVKAPPRRQSSLSRERKAKAEAQARKGEQKAAMALAFLHYGPRERPAKKTSLQRMKSRVRSFVKRKMGSPRSK